MGCDDVVMCMLGALAMFVMLAAIPLFLYWLWSGLAG